MSFCAHRNPVPLSDVVRVVDGRVAEQMDQSSRAVRVVEFLETHWPDVTHLAIVPLVLYASQLTSSSSFVKMLPEGVRAEAPKWGLWAAIVAIVVNTIVVICGLRRKRTLAECRRMQARADQEREQRVHTARDQLDGFLMNLAQQKLGFGTLSNNGERISLYIKYDAGTFLLAARFSQNPIYRDSRRKDFRPLGVVGRAWQDGSFFASDCPDRQRARRGYEQWHENLGLSTEEARSLRMPSRLYYARRIDNSADSNPVAVLVVEAIDPARFQEIHLSNVVGNEYRFLAQMIRDLRSYLPDLEGAAERGF